VGADESRTWPATAKRGDVRVLLRVEDGPVLTPRPAYCKSRLRGDAHGVHAGTTTTSSRAGRPCNVVREQRNFASTRRLTTRTLWHDPSIHARSRVPHDRTETRSQQRDTQNKRRVRGGYPDMSGAPPPACFRSRETGTGNLTLDVEVPRCRHRGCCGSTTLRESSPELEQVSRHRAPAQHDGASAHRCPHARVPLEDLARGESTRPRIRRFSVVYYSDAG